MHYVEQTDLSDLAAKNIIARCSRPLNQERYSPLETLEYFVLLTNIEGD